MARRRLELLSAELAALRRDAGPSAGAGAAQQPAAEQWVGEQPGAPTDVPGDTDASGRHARRTAGVAGAVGGWVEDRLPPTLQGRVQLGASHLTVVAVIVAAALAATAWFVVRSSPGNPVPAAAPAASHPPGALVSLSSPAPTGAGAAPAGAAAGSSAPSASPSGTVVVDVAGKVRHPGIATLPLGSRVVDALHAAGGARRGVSLRALNLARLLVDGEQIVVGVPPPAGVAASAASTASGASGAAGPSGSAGPLVNINTADEAALETLPQVGPVTAQAILKWRAENGSFTAVDELLDVSGIGDATLAEIAPFVTL